MQLVSELSLYPAVCAVTQRDDTAAERFLDTEASLKGQRVYLSESAIKPAASLLGYFTADEHSKVIALAADLDEQLNDALDEVAQLEAELGAIHMLRKRFSAEAKRGPKARA